MTTTLRPEGPERSTADGGRSRSYGIRVNGRRVGGLTLLAGEEDGERVGHVERLAVVPQERRRGRATIALLAAEEVLRGWGCRTVAARVPAQAPGALALVAALGYAERSRVMRKRLTAPPPPLPEGSTARAMGEGEFGAWLAEEREARRAALLAAGFGEEAAGRRVRDLVRHGLPDGPATAGAALRVLCHRGAPVGTLWISLCVPTRVPASGVPAGPSRPEAEAWIRSVRVRRRHRRRGHGRSLLLTAEAECLAAGGSLLGLEVCAGNVTARRLCESLGYAAAEHRCYKSLA